MRTYLIGYDLNKAGQDYKTLIEKIKEASNGFWWHHLDSTWVIQSNSTTVQIRDFLLPYIDNNDELLVLLLDGEAAWYGFNDRGSQWLLDNLK